MLDQYRKAIEIAKMGLWNWNPVTNEVTWSDEKFGLFGYNPQEFEVNMETAFKTVHPDDVAEIGKVLEQNLPTEDYFEYSYRGVKKQGDIIFVWVRVQVDRNDNGEPIMIHGISQNRTKEIGLEKKVRELNNNLEHKIVERTAELIKKNEQNEFLVKEIHHRVKNNLQVISSILNLQKSHIKDQETKNALDLCVKRIKSMALIHDSLLKYENLNNIGLVNYVNELTNVYRTKESIEFNVNVQDDELGLDAMVPIALILNELIANSCIHAFDSNSKPTISIDLKLNGDFFLTYSDNGKGLTNNQQKNKPSFGMEMIKTLSEGLEGDYSFTSSPNNGLQFNLKVPEYALHI